MTDRPASALHVRRLGAGDRDVARRLFALMADVFEEPNDPLDDAYLDALLGRDAFWALVALEGDAVVGGLTAHTLPMTRSACDELFIYDLAVRADRQRQGIGTRLMRALHAAAADAGIDCTFVPAETEDAHAVDFYRAIGGEAMAVTMFTFEPGARAVD